MSAFLQFFSINPTLFFKRLENCWHNLFLFLVHVIGGDLNGHVGATNVGFERVHGSFGYGSRSQEGEEVLNFALAYDLLIANTLFRKMESHLVTFHSGQHSS